MHTPAPPSTMKFISVPIVLRQPLLVWIGVVFFLGLLATQYDFDAAAPSDSFAWLRWLFGLVIVAIVAVVVYLYCMGVEVIIDPQTQRVSETHKFLHVVTAKNEWNFSAFEGVHVTEVLSHTSKAVSSPGSRGALSTTQSSTESRYELNLLRPPVRVMLQDREIVAPSVPLTLPIDQKLSRAEMDALAQQVSALGHWPIQ